MPLATCSLHGVVRLSALTCGEPQLALQPVDASQQEPEPVRLHALPPVG